MEVPKEEVSILVIRQLNRKIRNISQKRVNHVVIEDLNGASKTLDKKILFSEGPNNQTLRSISESDLTIRYVSFV